MPRPSPTCLRPLKPAGEESQRVCLERAVDKRVRWSRWEPPGKTRLPLYGIHSFDSFLISVTCNIKTTYRIAMPTTETLLHRLRISAPSTDVGLVGKRSTDGSCRALAFLPLRGALPVAAGVDGWVTRRQEPVPRLARPRGGCGRSRCCYLHSVVTNVSGIWLFDSYLMLCRITFKIKHCVSLNKGSLHHPDIFLRI